MRTRVNRVHLLPLCLVLIRFGYCYPQSPPIQEILDAVNIDSLYQTVEELCGTKAITRSGRIDTIWTRSNYSPHIRLAEQYIASRLEGWGYTVRRHPFYLPKTFFDIAFCEENQNLGWLISESTIYRTVDGGQEWCKQYQSPEPMRSNATHLSSLFVIDSNSVIVTVFSFDPKFYLRTDDGGATWVRRELAQESSMQGVYFLTDSVGYLCGYDGLIQRTTDAGRTWTTAPTPTSEGLTAIQFLNDRIGWAVGRKGTILRTDDGGNSWTARPAGTASHLSDLHFVDDRFGYICGRDRTLLKTSDGGELWHPLALPAESLPYLQHVDFFDPSHGVVTCLAEDVLTTADGGKNWTLYDGIFPLSSFMGLAMLDNSTFWIGGADLLTTSADLGGTWMNALHRIADFDGNNLIAEKPGTVFPDGFYILSAHYDTHAKDEEKPAPGADDDASGTAAVIEAARVLRTVDFPYSVRFIAFAGEEEGLYGSRAYAQDAAALGENILGVINLDMIGYDSDDDGRFDIITGPDQRCIDIGEFLKANVSDWSLDLKTKLSVWYYHSLGDHASFWDAGFPAVDVEENWLLGDETPFYHTTGDLPSTLNRGYFHNLSRLATGTLALLAEGALTAGVHPAASTPPENFRLLDPYPNPFNAETVLTYDLPRSVRISLTIVDALGRRIRSIEDGIRAAGRHRARWDGTTDLGQFAPSGIYFLRLEARGLCRHKKMLLVR